jgi:hypothetical protein
MVLPEKRKGTNQSIRLNLSKLDMAEALEAGPDDVSRVVV